MRVTDTSLYRQVIQRLARNSSQIERALGELSDGKRVRTGGDDPAGARAALELRGQFVRNEGYLRTAGAARASLETIDQVLGQVFNLITEARTRTSAGASGTQDGATDIIAVEIDSIRDTLINLANTTQRGRYLFSGTATLTPAYDDAGVYGGNAGETAAPVTPDTQVGVTIDGSRAFQGAAGDVLQTLADISTALRADDTAALEVYLGDLKNQLDEVLGVRTEIGTRLQTIDRAIDRLGDEQIRIQARVSGIEDANIAESATLLASASNAQDALSAATARVLGRSLFDYLG